MARLWLFDFDGTLVDSEKAIKACYLKVGQELVPDRCNYIEKMVIGPTLDESTKKILTNKRLNLVGVFKEKFQALYDDLMILKTPQYENVEETLTKIYNLGDKLCIVTNKRSNPTNKLINYYGWNYLFDWVACIDDFPEVSNKSELISIKNINKNSFENIYFVGDTCADGKAAEFHNIPFIKANYGYGSNENWKKIRVYKKINNFIEILNI